MMRQAGILVQRVSVASNKWSPALVGSLMVVTPPFDPEVVDSNPVATSSSGFR